MIDLGRCSSCGLPLDASGPAGLCPACLLNLGLAAATGATGAQALAGTTSADALTGMTGASAVAGSTGAGGGAADGDATHMSPVALGRAAHSTSMADVPSVIGPYHLLQALGEGGMGLVYLAEQREPIVRRVALKLIKPGMDSRDVLARFEAERQALALMDHPNIARVLDAGLGPQNRPYFVMEYVAGVPLTDYCDRHRLRNPERLQIFLQVCAALQHAHQKGVIHRDLKPSNILVTVQDGKPVPKVIDFGIAKATHQGRAEQAAFTQLGMLIGTPEYMSPEQAEASGLEVDTTTDIYSLGVILYELLTGVLPFDGETLRRAGYLEMHRIIREQDPPKPSTRAGALGATTEDVARHHQTSAGALGKALRGDLDAITLKAMEKDRTRRYASASEFAADITRYLNGEAVVARPASVMYRTRKFVRRHKVGVAASALVIAALVVGLVMSTAFYLRSEASLREADRERKSAAEQSYLANITAADLLLRSQQSDEARKRLAATPVELRGWEWDYLHATADSSAATIGSQAGAVTSVAFTPDGTRILALSTTGVLQAVDAMTHLPVPSFRYPVAAPVPEGIIATSPDGSRYASIAWRLEGRMSMQPNPGKLAFMAEGASSPDAQDIVTIKEVATGTPLAHVRSPNLGKSLPVDPFGVLRGVRYFSVDSYSLTDMATGRPIVRMAGRGHAPAGAAFSADGQRLAVWSWDNILRVWEVRSAQLLGTFVGHRDGISDAAFSRDGSRLASASYDGTIRTWQIGSPAATHVLSRHDGGVTALAFSQDGRTLASGGSDKTVRLWDGTTGELIATCAGHRDEVMSVAFSPDGRMVASASQDRTIRLWDAVSRDRSVVTLLGHASAVTSIAFSADGRHLVSGSTDATVRVWNLDRVRSLLSPGTSDRPFYMSKPTANLERIATNAPDGGIRVWKLSSPGDAATMNVPANAGDIRDIALSLDGRRLVAATSNNALLAWNTEEGGVMTLTGHGNTITAVALSPDSDRAASASADGSIRIWDLRSARSVHILQQLGRTSLLAFSPDGRSLAVVLGRAVDLWDIDTEQSRGRLEGQSADVGEISFSADGARLVLGRNDGTLDVWDVPSRRRLATLSGHQTNITSVAVDPTGQRIVSTDGKGTLRIWNARSFQSLLAVEPGQKSLWLAAFSADGRRVLTASRSDVLVLDSRSAYPLEAVRIVDDLFARHFLASEVIAQVRRVPGIDAAVRDRALELAERRGDDPAALDTESMRLAKTVGASMQEYQRALAYAERSTALLPFDRDFGLTLSYARCRVGRDQECVASLAKSTTAESLALLVIAQQRLGNVAAARAGLQRLRTAVAKRGITGDEILHALAAEAELAVRGVLGKDGVRSPLR